MKIFMRLTGITIKLLVKNVTNTDIIRFKKAKVWSLIKKKNEILIGPLVPEIINPYKKKLNNKERKKYNVDTITKLSEEFNRDNILKALQTVREIIEEEKDLKL